MQKNGGKARSKGLRSYVKKVESVLRGVKLPSKTKTLEGARNKLKTFLAKDFSFEGYIPPKKPANIKDPSKKAKAPDLSNLIEVDVVLAAKTSGNDSKKPNSGPSMVRAGAFIKIKSVKDKTFSTYWYQVGETIGAGHSFRGDADPVLKKWGPCVLLDVTPEGIVCAWNKEADKVNVDIQLHPDPENVDIHGTLANGQKVKLGGPGKINKLKGTVGVVTPASVGVSYFRPGRDKNGDSVVEFTSEGWKQLNDSGGEKLLSELGTKKVKGGVEVTSIPRQLQEFGLQPGDVVIRVDNQKVTSKASVTNYVRKNRGKKSFGVTVLRGGVPRTFTVRVPKNTQGLNTNTNGIRFGK